MGKLAYSIIFANTLAHKFNLPCLASEGWTLDIGAPGTIQTVVCGPVGLMEPKPGPNIPAVTDCAMVMKRRRLLYLAAGLGWAGLGWAVG